MGARATAGWSALLVCCSGAPGVTGTGVRGDIESRADSTEVLAGVIGPAVVVMGSW